jgi:hypothetical protein
MLAFGWIVPVPLLPTAYIVLNACNDRLLLHSGCPLRSPRKMGPRDTITQLNERRSGSRYVERLLKADRQHPFLDAQAEDGLGEHGNLGVRPTTTEPAAPSDTIPHKRQ